jgi:protein subunit release factor B
MKGARAMAIIVEIRAAEGGADARDLVDKQLEIYVRRATRRRL